MNTLPAAAIAYQPVDVLKPVAENVWIVDSGPLSFGPFLLPVRMTAIRLASGEMWLHSPTRFDEALKRSVEAIGPVRHLVAPNIAHWSYLKDWQERCPQATTWAAPKLRERAKDVRLDRDLADAPPEPWAGEIEQVVVPGAFGFREVAFFHKATRTLLLTDLIVNLEADKTPPLTRAFAQLTGTLSPNGRAPAYLRLLLRMAGEPAKAAARRLLACAPERVIFAHGRWFERDGTRELRRALSWLVA